MRLLYFSIVFAFFADYCECVEDIHFVSLDDVEREWWTAASIYQIYPRSFKDSDGDGIGDLNGITEKLEYLKEIGFDATWLSPIFKSPMKDFGYDISDYYSIQPEYGTMDDFDRMVAKAHSLGIKIILDFVPNHSSDLNEWFIKSESKVPGFEDYYVWHPGYPHPNDPSNRLPPSNWLSFFHGSAWKWSEKRGEFYYHQFLAGQPDLNYRNPKVAEEMKNILNFWLKRGVYGFRIDATAHMYEVLPDETGRYPDEPLSGYTNDSTDWAYLKHIYTINQPEVIDMIYEWRAVLDSFRQENGGEERIMLTEASFASPELISKYFGNATNNGSHVPFNFEMLGLWNGSNAHDYIRCMDDFMKIVPKHQVPNWVMGNHDNHRVASRLGTYRIDMVNMFLLTLPGISVTYNGEEIGMMDQWLSWKDTVDPSACNTNPSIYEQFSRDPERTPFQWDDTKNAGFSTADKTWLPVADTYRYMNVEQQEVDERSHLKVFESLRDLKDEPTLRDGDTKYAALSEQVVAIVRYFDGEKLYVAVANLGPYVEKVDLNALGLTIPKKMAYHIVGTSSTHKVNNLVESKNVILQPRESFVLRSEVAVNQAKYVEYFHYTIDES